MTVSTGFASVSAPSETPDGTSVDTSHPSIFHGVWTPPIFLVEVSQDATTWVQTHIIIHLNQCEI